MFHIGDRDTAPVQFGRGLFVGGAERAVNATPGEEHTLDVVDVFTKLIGRTSSFVGPEPVGDLDDFGPVAVANTFVNHLLESIADRGAGRAEGACHFGRGRAQ